MLDSSHMMAAAVVDIARSIGIRIGIDGETLTLEAPTEPPHEVVALLRRHKSDILKLLREADDGWSAEDWRAFFDERAGVVEFDGRLPRAEAEAVAYADCLAEWMKRNEGASATEGLAALMSMDITDKRTLQ